MNKQPELPDFWRDLEIVQALGKEPDDVRWLMEEQVGVQETAQPEDPS